MDYLRNFKIKPHEITGTGVVLFTDGTNESIYPSQLACEAYGYRYDSVSGSCMAFNPPMQLLTKAPRNKCLSKGVNTIGFEASNTILAGDNNIVSSNRNALVIGSAHELESDYTNCSVVGGQRALISRQGETALGGGKRTLTQQDGEDDFTISSRRQTSTIELAGTTMDNTATNLTVQGMSADEVFNPFINVKPNSIVGYDIYITRLELGGSAYVSGNFSYRNIRGAVKVNRTGAMTFYVGFSRNIAKAGQNGTCIMADTTTGGVPSFSVNVQDRNNVHNLWSASVTLHEVISETAF